MRRRIFHQPFGRLQPSGAVPIPISLARLRTVLVVVSPDGVAGLAIQRFLNNQSGAALARRRGAGVLRAAEGLRHQQRSRRPAGEWPRERFRTHGVDYVTAVKPKNDMSDPLIGAGSSGRNGCPTLHRLFEFDRL